MKPGKYDWDIYSGATFIQTIAWYRDVAKTQQIDFNEYRGLMEIRKGDGTLILALSTDNGRFAPQIDKRARLFIDDNDTRVMPVGNYDYDLLVEEIVSGIVTPLLAGKARVKELVTRNEP